MHPGSHPQNQQKTGRKLVKKARTNKKEQKTKISFSEDTPKRLSLENISHYLFGGLQYPRRTFWFDPPIQALPFIRI
ncbi:MAG: hypothetical protein IPL92_15650 [Saprospiraceae bacterium]|nr:hypothetical protein [Candidatus Opimibacter iunctus]